MSEHKILLDQGIYDIQDGLFSSAIEKITKSIEMKSDWEIPYFYRAVAHQALENFDDALLDYTKAIQINSKMTDAYYNRAKIILSRKDLENPNIELAVKDLEVALSLDDKFLDAMYAIACAHKKLGNYNVAVDYLDKLINIEPEAVNARALKKLLLQKYL